MRKRYVVLIFTLLMYVLWGCPAIAEQFDVGGKPMNLMGYITQGVAVSLSDQDKYDSERDFQSAITNVLIEGDYKPRDNIRLYLSGMFTADWIYDLKSNDSSWNNKLFDHSRKNLYMDNEGWQLLKEANVTWFDDSFMVKVGKQIVTWGETDGFRLMDQINPQDPKRGFADVEYDTTVIPIWLVRAEYFLKKKPAWLQDLGFEMVFNPNAEFIRNQGIQLGNDEGGIWAPNALADIGGGMQAHVGSAYTNLDEPGTFSRDGFEYALRIKGAVADSTVTLNYYYGLDKDPVTKMIGMTPPTIASDGNLILHPVFEGHYPLFRFVGGTFSKDITPLRSDILGGVSPVLRMEGFYAFSNTFANSLNDFEKKDELRLAIGADWKVKCNLLNPSAYINIGPQFYVRKILNYPTDHSLSGLYENNYMTTLGVSTTYFHNKLTPSIFWLSDRTNKADFIRYQAIYDYSNEWRITVGATTFNGKKEGQGFQLFEDKEQFYFKVSYKFG